MAQGTKVPVHAPKGRISVNSYTAAKRTTVANRRISPVNRQYMDEVQSLLANMVPYSTIEKSLSAKWRKPRRFVSSVIKWVHEEWAFASQDPEFHQKRRDQIRVAFQQLYMKAAAQQDTRTMGFTLRELGHLDGVYAPKQMDISGQVSGSIGVGIGLAGLGYKSPEEVHARLEELRQRLAEHGPQALAIGQNGKPVIDIQVAENKADEIENAHLAAGLPQ